MRGMRGRRSGWRLARLQDCQLCSCIRRCRAHHLERGPKSFQLQYYPSHLRSADGACLELLRPDQTWKKT